jgi:hypothetical protein
MEEGSDGAGSASDSLSVPGRRRNARPERIGAVEYGWPVLDEEADAVGGVGVRIRFAFEPLSGPWRCAALFLRMSFDDARIEVLDAGVDPALGAVSVSGLSSNIVGWYVDRPHGDVPPEVIARATLSVPQELTELTGTLRAELPVVRAGLILDRKAHARTPRIREFALPLPGRPSSVAAPADAGVAGSDRSVVGAQASKVSEPTAAVRLCFAADIEQYSRFRTPEAVRAQQRLTEALARARRHAGIAEDRVETQESGDGQFVVLPTGLDESEVIPALVHGFRIALAEANADLNERARLRLRIALHRGHIERGANGWAGVSAVGVHRILDSAPARAALTSHSDTDFVLIVPDSLYQDVIAHGYGLLRPEAFTRVDVEIPAKNFVDRAWIYVPGPW